MPEPALLRVPEGVRQLEKLHHTHEGEDMRAEICGTRAEGDEEAEEEEEEEMSEVHACFDQIRLVHALLLVH